MDVKIRKAFEDTMNHDLLEVVISNSSNKDEMSKVKIRPVILKDEFYFQVTEYKGDQVFHSNDTKEALLDRLPVWFEGLFKQVEIETKKVQVFLLISKKGNATVKIKKAQEREEENTIYLHNRKKNYILEEGKPIPFLIDLGVMTKDGLIIKAKSDKFRQINRFLEYIEDILPNLDKEKELSILDFGCGKSYLTFAIYYYLKELKGYQIRVIGLDLKVDVISNCNTLSQKYGYEKLHFLQGDIATYDGSNSVDMVVTLHACDTATDHALYKAVSWGAKVILAVPCCQHELNGQIDCKPLRPVLKYGLIKERMAALFTDAFRANLLESKGYMVQILEFIDMEHTPKNILIRAVKKNSTNSDPESKIEDYLTSMELLGVAPTLQRLFQQDEV